MVVCISEPSERVLRRHFRRDIVKLPGRAFIGMAFATSSRATFTQALL
jgi:hypothetical protein